MLARTDYDPRALSFFSRLGVTYYLDRDVVFATLRAFAAVALAGSPVIFDYPDTEAFVPETAARRIQLMQGLAAIGRANERRLEPRDASRRLARLGWRLREKLSPSAIEQRHFHGRTDGYHAFEQVHFAQAVVG